MVNDIIFNEEEIIIEGKIKRYLFHGVSNGYSVAKVRLYEMDEKIITIVGYFPGDLKDVLLRFTGSYVDNPRFGLQFKVASFCKIIPNDPQNLVRFLSSINFPGIGKKFAQNMVDTLGTNLITQIKDDAKILWQVPKMTEQKYQSLISGLISENEDINNFLQANGFSLRNIQKIKQIYGSDAMTILRQNPYKLVEDINGIGFITADKLAKNLGFLEDSPLRIQAHILSSVIGLSMRNGDTYIKVEQLINQYRDEFTQDYLFEHLETLFVRKQVYQEEDRLYHHSQYKSEVFISDFLHSLRKRQDDEIVDEQLLLDLVQDIQTEFNIIYDEIQTTAILMAVKTNFMLLTGGPGTGKTTVVRAITKLLKKVYPTSFCVLCAPTGRAAKRLNELSDNETSTIHSLLKWNLETNTFAKNIHDPLSYDCIIVDECSMVDNWLMYNLLLASAKVKKFIFIGDKNQLPSVSPGAVLRDLLETKMFSTIELNKIYRQKEGSEVIQLAHNILSENEEIYFKGEARFIECSNESIRNHVIKLLQSALNRGYNINDIQVLTCKYDGIAGIDNLNMILQNQFNPANPLKKEIRHSNRILRENDKVLQLKNLHDNNVYNGDIGIITEINIQQPKYKSTVIVDFEGNIIEYIYEDLTMLNLAYCMSVHKAQGSEYPIVIMPFSKADFFMLDKKLIYTAITRCSKSLILLGDITAFYQGIKTNERHKRMTTLKERLND